MAGHSFPQYISIENQTTVTRFIFLGLSDDPQMQIFLFLVVLDIYLITLVGNIIIMVVIRADSHLHSPMYFFLFHLSFFDILSSSVTVPNMLVNFLVEHKTISFKGCMTQMFFIFLSACTEVSILSAMAYDRYVAICDPLWHYVEIMSKPICVLLLSCAWILGVFYALLNTLFALKLHFCGASQIRHFSCELPPLLKLSCSGTFTSQMVLLTCAVIIGSCNFFVTLISYIYIISTILRVRSAEGRHKAFSTCSSHLIVVGLWYLTCFFEYTKPSSVSSVVLDEMFSFQYSIVTPMLNPIIYSLKNKEVKRALGKMLGKRSFLK